jgi:hypothetical protein
MRTCFASRKCYEASQRTIRGRSWRPDRQYPKAVGQAIRELKARGLAIEYGHLRYLILTKRIGYSVFPKAPPNRQFAFTAGQLDDLAEYLAGQGRLTPTAQMCMALNLDYDQFERALREAGKDAIGTPLPTSFRMVVHPAESDGCARVEFLRPNRKGGK